MTYKVGDRIAHPLHGAGVISGVERQRIGGEEREYYILKMPVGDMLIKIPTDTCDLVGVRPIISRQEAEQLMNAIPSIHVEMTSNWNKRYRENMLHIRSGNLMEVAAVVKGLMNRDNEHGLSTGERKMLHSAKQILISEIVLSENSSYAEIECRLNMAMV